MFKAVREDKIISISDKADFPLLMYDIVEEDTEHTVDDYVHINGQFLLKTSDEAKKQKAAEVRAERDKYIADIWWRIDRYQTQLATGIETTDSEGQYKGMLRYIQALRDVPEQDGFPDTIEWPEKPE